MKRGELILIGLFLLALSGLYIDSVASDELEMAIKILIWSIVAIALIGILVLVIIVFAHIHLRLKLNHSQIVVSTRDAEVLTITASADDQVYIRDINPKASWINPALDPRPQFGPTSPLATFEDQQRWQMAMEVKALGAMPKQIINQANDGVPLLESMPAINWPEKVDLFDLLPSSGNGNLDNIILGIHLDEMGNQTVIQTSLEDMVHCAFGGETGTGKSTLAYSIAYQVATAHQDVKLVLADTAGTTWKTLADCENLMFPIISNERDCLHVLNHLHNTCVHRTEELFAQYPTVEKLSEFNAIVDPKDRLGYITMFIDEFPDYLLDKDIQIILKRLIRKSRKAGISLFGMGTSWKHTDMDTSIRRQFRTKVHFGASDEASSRVLLGTNDANDLKVIGRAYTKLPFGMSNDNKPVEMQAVWVDKVDVMNRLNHTILDLPTSPVAARPSMAEKAVIDAHKSGTGLKECFRIFAKVDGRKMPKNIGGNQTRTIKDILSKWGIEE